VNPSILEYIYFCFAQPFSIQQPGFSNHCKHKARTSTLSTKTLNPNKSSIQNNKMLQLTAKRVVALPLAHYGGLGQRNASFYLRSRLFGLPILPQPVACPLATKISVDSASLFANVLPSSTASTSLSISHTKPFQGDPLRLPTNGPFFTSIYTRRAPVSGRIQYISDVAKHTAEPYLELSEYANATNKIFIEGENPISIAINGFMAALTRHGLTREHPRIGNKTANVYIESSKFPPSQNQTATNSTSLRKRLRRQPRRSTRMHQHLNATRM
jgi:hypothetical protein